MNIYYVLGLMSGTSLDGLDLAYSKFIYNEGKWTFEIKNTQTITYSLMWKERLVKAETLSGFDFICLHKEYGNYVAQLALDFIHENNLKPDFVASHGHTIFHQPEKNITYQIGDGAAMTAVLKLPVICDFRSVDVALKGQGAPLVPVGDELLFSEYFFRLNLGGIANISFKQNEKIIAYDICPFNMPMNHFAQKLGTEYDKNGAFASSGIINHQLLDHLNSLNYYKIPFPKSLGKEWFLNDFLTITEKYKISVQDKIRTIAEHIVTQIVNSTGLTSRKKMLITGGGAHNKFLISLLKEKSTNKIIIPADNIIDFKEALIFGFLGVLRFRNEINCLRSVTGALYDNIGGCIYTS